ncbi:hypothetical protein GUK30_32505 [Rhizobium leguminosarum]|uniref:hypothetical protein n=1 Tax=Rhizobium ruizarguesonis TaxID=2081791 RepID=UPI0013C246EE|nr:hypothetical protein [Rhizobium ruizarguesonis]NEI24069.1 hypothetical protein [Rhizobium ruizarguesonis]
MSKDEKPKPTVYSPPDDPLGIDTDKDFNAEARRIARDAIEGGHKEAVEAEIAAALRRWGMTPKRSTDDPDPSDEIVDLKKIQ